MVQHLISLLDHLNLTKVIVLGHDWGVRPATRFVLYHPERTLGLILFNVGYEPPAKRDVEKVLQFTKETFGYELFGYWEFINSDDAAKIFEENADGALDIWYSSDPKLWKTDLAPLVRQVITEGVQSKLNWYKSVIINIDWDDEKDLDPTIKRPVLYVAGTKDYILVPQFFANQKQHISNLETIELNTSHWTMEEKPEDVNQIVEKWIEKIV
ncbi:unnamed protein product [Adineta steineri]|nr:unnamed protein product [Adineta steineri]